MKSGRKIVRLAQGVSPGFAEEHIHKMRTTIKKMRALSDWRGKPLTGIFRKYYKTAGKIRDVQLLINKINRKHLNIPSSFKIWLESRLHELKVEWQKSYDEEKLRSDYRKIEKSLEGLKQKKHSLKFAEEKNANIFSFRNQRPLSDEQIHNGRKTIKEIDLLNKWENKSSDEEMKKLSDETGDFMDTCSEIKLLDMYIEEEDDDAKRIEAMALRAEWEKNKNEEKAKLLNSIDSLPG